MRTWAFVLLLLLALPRLAAAQADVLTGKIMGTDGTPIPGARVQATSVETEITRSVVADANGRYMIIFPDGGGRYVLRVSFIGMADQVLTLMREADEELLMANITLSPQPIELEGITVRAQMPQPGRGEAGEQSTELSQDMLNRLPLPDLDPNTLALLAAGVVSTALDSLSGRMGFSVAGMSDMLNQVTLDGVILGQGQNSMGVPEEGVRRTQVTTSTYDASRGGFAGGQIAMTTARGNNRAAGAVSYRLDDDALQWTSSPTTTAFTRHNIGGSWGGPIVRNRLFYNASFQVQRNANHRFALTDQDPLGAQRSGVAVDSIGHFLSILDNTYGFSTVGQTGPYTQFSDDIRLQGRMDWSLAQRRSQSQTLSARVNLNYNNQDSTRINTLDLAQHGGNSDRNSRLGTLSLTSRFGTNWTNALSLSYSESWSNTLPFIAMPEGRVQVTSDFEDGTRGTNTLTFGGNRNMPTDGYSRDLQLSNDLSFLLPIGSQLHRLKVGGNIQRSRDINLSTDNIFGSFSFNSLEDFQNNLPYSYTRALTARDSRTGSINTGFYVGDTWRVSQPLEFTLGVRWDYTRLDQRPAYNPAIETAFGRRTDIDPAATSVSPRVGFSYRLNKQGQPTRALSGGLGLFSGRPPTSIFSVATRQTGLPDAEQTLNCIGDAVPIPDWQAYLLDPTSVPSMCADGGTGTPGVLSSRLPTVTLIDPSQSLPSSLRLDLGYRTQLPFRLFGNFRYTYSMGLGLWGYRDLNLDESKVFMLGTENRPFFGDPSAIVDYTGAVSMTTSRLHPEFGNVYDVVSSRRSATQQLTTQVSGLVGPKLTFSANYTLSFSRDQGSGSFSSATTAGDPNQVEWAASNNDRRHTMNLMLSYAITPEFEISATGRASSGQPFTPLVNRDINGDGARNDRAYVFDPTVTADTSIANAMSRLLTDVPGRVQSCLESQFGSIAGRNSCRNGWTESLDMRASIRPNLPTLQRRMTLSVDARNVLTGLDQLINGTNHMQGWGEGQRADGTLLQVTGFDPTTNSFRYQVNEGFGQTRRGPNAFRSAFSLTISARIAVGGQAFLNNRGFGNAGFGGMRGFGGGGFGGRGGGRNGGLGGGGFGGGRGGFAGGDLRALMRGEGAGPVNVDSLVDSWLANPMTEVLARKDSLGLNADQLARVQLIADSLGAQLSRHRTELDRRMPTLNLNSLAVQPGGRRMGQSGQQVVQQFQAEVQPQIDAARRETAEAMRMTQTVLTPEQWQKLPESVRNAIQDNANRARGINIVAMLDRMLANPIPVLLSLKDTLHLTPDQVTRVQAISDSLQARLNQQRDVLGKRFDNVEPGQQQGRLFQEIQPQIDAARKDATEALKKVEKILTKDQWKQVPERVKNPFQTGFGRRGG